MNDNSTFNTDIYEKAVVSFKTARRVLVKYGKVSRFKVTRYYILQNEFLLYFKNTKCEKSISSFSLSNCFYSRDNSKIKKIQFSVKVITADQKKTFWLHPIQNEEISMLERYIKCVSEGKFNNDQIIQQLLLDPNNLSNKEKCTSAFSSHLQLGFASSNTTSHLNNYHNRGSQNSNQDPPVVGSKFQGQINRYINNDQLNEEQSESEKTKGDNANIYHSYNSQMKQLEPQGNMQTEYEQKEEKVQQQKQHMKYQEQEQIRNQQQALQTLNSLERKNTIRESVKLGKGNEVNQHQLQNFTSNAKYINDKQLQNLPSDRQGMLVTKKSQEEQQQQQKRLRESLSVPYLNQLQGMQNSHINVKDIMGNNIQGNIQINNEYLITLGQMSQNNMFTNQANASYDNKQNISMDKYNGATISQIFKNMDNNISSNQIQESGNFIPSAANFHGASQLDGVAGMIDKDISAIIKANDHSPYLDIDADLKFSSDEELSNNKNQKLETVRMQYEFHSPNANKGYYFGQNANFFQNNHIHNNHNPNSNNNYLQTGLNQVKAKLFQENSNYDVDNNNNQGYGLYAVVSNSSLAPSSTKLMNQVNPTSSTNATQNIISPRTKISFQQGSYNNLQNQIQYQQQEMKEKNYQPGPCNFSSSTLQNIYFPESQKNYTESPQGSFFSHKIDTNTQFLEGSQQSNSKIFGFQQQKKQNKKKDLINLSDVYDLSDQENISSDDGEQAPSTHFCIKQQVFYAGASRIFIEDALSQNNLAPEGQRNSRIGVITNYSFDKKTLSDTDLFEQEEGNFQKSAIDIMREEEEKQKKNQHIKRGSENLTNTKKGMNILQLTSQPQNQQNHLLNQQYLMPNLQQQNKANPISQFPSLNLKNPIVKSNLRYAEGEEEQDSLQGEASTNNRNTYKDDDMGNYLDEEDDNGNPAVANNVTYIIERYKEQNYNEKNSSFFNSHNNLMKKNDLSSISSHNSKPQAEKNPLNQISQNNLQRGNHHMQHHKSVSGFRQNASQSKRSLSNLTIDPEQCNVQYKENEKEIPQIKDKKEFYNKKNIIGYIVPKMEETLSYMHQQQDNQAKTLKQQISVDKCFNDGYYYLWSFQFQNTHDIFKIHREENINFEYALLEHNLLKIIVTGNKDLIATTEAKFAEFFEYLQACQKDVQKKGDKSEIKCLKNISKMTIDLIKAECHLVRGLLSAFLNNKFQSFIQFKNAYSQFQKVKQKIESSISKTQTIDQYLQKEQDIYTQSRYYFVSGLFNIGLSMIPNYFLKILSLIGIQPNKQYGYECLEKCIELKSIRSSYASLLLCIEYIELNPNVEKSILIIKKMIKALPQCPLFYWMASLLSWRYAKPDDALNLINKSLWNCGEKLGDVAFYLKFEKGWYNVSQFDWKSALGLFEEIVVMALDIDNFDIDTLVSLAQSKKLNPKVPQLMIPFIEKAKQKYPQKYKIILPHKCCLVALIACCYEDQGLNDHMDLWLLMTQYLNKKSNDHKTGVDEDISKLCAKYITRQNKQFIKYEILYFVKEITKLRDDMLQKMIEEIQFYYDSEYSSIQEIFYKKIFQKNNQKAIDFGSTIFLRIVSGCLSQDFSMVYSSGKILDKIAEFIPSDHHYILHHSYHWLARCQMQQSQFSNSKENLKKCLKYKKCEFTLENKSQKLLTEMDFAK